jgi:predicted DCC family thiol-disulfide oxidoreductase YuxK
VISDAGRAVILFDGVCNLCNATVRFVIERDRGDKFRFAPLQGPAARALLDRVRRTGPNRLQGLSSLDPDPGGPASILLLEESKAYEKSAAALRIARHLGGAYPLLYGLVLVPRFLRDAVYDLVARNRYRWFGKREACMVPTPELREKFLT